MALMCGSSFEMNVSSQGSHLKVPVEHMMRCDPWAGGRPLYLYLYLNLYLYLEWMYSEEEAVECMKVKRVATPGPWGPTGPSGHIVHLQAEPRYATTSAPVSR